MKENSTVGESLIKIYLNNQRESFEVFKEKQAEAKAQANLNPETTTTMPIPEEDAVSSKNSPENSTWSLWIWILIFALIFFLLWRFLSHIFKGIREYRELQEETDKTYEYLQKKYEETPVIHNKVESESPKKGESLLESQEYKDLIANQEVKF